MTSLRHSPLKDTPRVIVQKLTARRGKTLFDKLKTAIQQIPLLSHAIPKLPMKSPFDEIRSGHPIVIGGHSHVTALTGRLLSEGIEVRKIEGTDEVYDYCGPWLRTAAYWETLRLAPPNVTIVLLWCGNEHHSAFLLAPTPLFDFVPQDASDGAINNDAILVPESLMRAKLGLNMDHLGAVLRDIRAHSSARVVVAGTPPPKGDLDAVRNLMKAEWFFNEIAKQQNFSLDDVKLTPLPIQHKMWSLVQNMLREMTIANGGEFISVPASVMTEAGFLRQEMWSNDATHANAAYGKEMIAHLVRMLRAQGR